MKIRNWSPVVFTMLGLVASLHVQSLAGGPEQDKGFKEAVALLEKTAQAVDTRVPNSAYGTDLEAVYFVKAALDAVVDLSKHDETVAQDVAKSLKTLITAVSVRTYKKTDAAGFTVETFLVGENGIRVTTISEPGWISLDRESFNEADLKKRKLIALYAYLATQALSTDTGYVTTSQVAPFLK